jgi:hypothetical protein
MKCEKGRFFEGGILLCPLKCKKNALSVRKIFSILFIPVFCIRSIGFVAKGEVTRGKRSFLPYQPAPRSNPVGQNAIL